MNKRNTLLIIIIINLILASIVTILYFSVFRPNKLQDEWTLTITGEIDEEIVLTLEDLKAMPNISKEYYILGNPSYSANYTGISLSYLITIVANITSNVNVRVIAIDQYSYSLNLINDIIPEPNIIIAFIKNGEAIKYYSDGGEGPLRLIIPQKYSGDFNGQYCVKYVSELEIYT